MEKKRILNRKCIKKLRGEEDDRRKEISGNDKNKKRIIRYT
jgi:hypothetical protein